MMDCLLQYSCMHQNTGGNGKAEGPGLVICIYIDVYIYDYNK